MENRYPSIGAASTFLGSVIFNEYMAYADLVKASHIDTSLRCDLRELSSESDVLIDSCLKQKTRKILLHEGIKPMQFKHPLLTSASLSVSSYTLLRYITANRDVDVRITAQ